MANYFPLEDPDEITPVGVELTLEARLGDVRLRGILDRLDRTPDGDLVVVDYKTGRAPGPAYVQARLSGVQLYALLCQEVLGRRPVQVRLLHLKEPTVITAEPSEQGLRGQRTKTLAVWSAIERACRDEDFRPKTGPLCRFCRFPTSAPPTGRPGRAAVALGNPAGGRHEHRGGHRVPGPARPAPRATRPRRAPPRRRRRRRHRVDRMFEPLRGLRWSTRRPRSSPGSATTGCCGPGRRLARPALGSERRAAVRALGVAGVSSSSGQRRGQAGGRPRAARPPRPAHLRHRGAGTGAEDEQFPERAHAGRLLLGRRARVDPVTGRQRLPLLGGRTDRRQPHPPAGPPRVRRGRGHGHRHRPGAARPASPVTRPAAVTRPATLRGRVTAQEWIPGRRG